MYVRMYVYMYARSGWITLLSPTPSLIPYPFFKQLHASPPWLLAFLLSTLFQTYWDVAQDWGILVWEEVDDDESQFGCVCVRAFVCLCACKTQNTTRVELVV